MIPVNWLLEAEMFDAYRDELAACIRAAGHEMKIVHPPKPPYRWGDAGPLSRDTFEEGACVVALGDIEFVTHITRERLWVPGAFATVDNFACSSYLCRLGRFALNRDYVMLPFGELSRQRDFLFRTVGVDGRIFVRPDSPLKLFAGQVAARDTFDADLELLRFYEFPRSAIVLVSAPRHIRTEWRFVVAQGKIVTGCQYKADGRKDLQPRYDADAGELAAQVAAEGYAPDPVWIVDICRTDDDRLHLLEIGGFSFADLYACDKGAIVRAVSQAAAAEWERARGATGPRK